MDNNQISNNHSLLDNVVTTRLGDESLLSNQMLSSTNSTFSDKQVAPHNCVASYPLLQNVTESSASVVWALNTPATGWIEWGTTPSLGKISRNSEFGLNPYETDFLSARLKGLTPNTRYYYRTVTCTFDYKTAYDKTLSSPQFSDIYSFETLGINYDKVSFAVMNDTHNNLTTIQAHLKKVEELNPDFLFWNGDLCSDYMNVDRVKTCIANPNNKPFASEHPLIFVPGNHDRRGKWVRNLKKCLTTWEQNDTKFSELGYNYAFRKGAVAFVVLDTGEDKPDWHPAWSGMANYQPYRELQTIWLDNILSSREIQSAPFIIAFCHIPLHDSDPNANPGNILDGWASFQWSTRQMWGPIFDKHRVQLLITAHQHYFNYAEPDSERTWAQIIGGGPEIKNACNIYGEATQKELQLTCRMLRDDTLLGAWTYKPRF